MGEVFSIDDEGSAFSVDSLYDSILETPCEKSRRYVVTLSCSPLQLDFVTVPMECQNRGGTIVQVAYDRGLSLINSLKSGVNLMKSKAFLVVYKGKTEWNLILVCLLL